MRHHFPGLHQTRNITMATPGRSVLVVLLFLCTVGYAHQHSDQKKDTPVALLRVKRQGSAPEQLIQLHLAENQDGGNGEQSLVRVKRMRRTPAKPYEKAPQAEELAEQIHSSDKDSGHDAKEISHVTRKTNSRKGRIHHEKVTRAKNQAKKDNAKSAMLLEGKHKAHYARSHKSPENHRLSKHQEGKHSAHVQRKGLHGLEQQLKDLMTLRRDVNQDLDKQIKKLRSERKAKRMNNHKTGKKNTHKKH